MYRSIAFPAFALALLLTPSAATLQEAPVSASLELSPHCEEEDIVQCPTFETASPVSLQTPVYKPGDTVDLDLVLVNPNFESVQSYRVWISYDTSVLKGVKVAANEKTFPITTPGEVDFDAQEGSAKIAATSTEGLEPHDPLIRLGRITFTVLPGAKSGSTPLAFYDVQNTTEGHTYVTAVSSGTQSITAQQLGSLLVRVGGSAAAVSSAPADSGISSSSAHVQSSVTSSSVSSAAVLPAAPAAASGTVIPGNAAAQSVFTLLQIQGVRIGTNQDTIAVTWDTLGHPRLQGYSVYYGNAAGQYLHRKSVSVASRGIIIDSLTPGKTYYVAVRGVDDAGEETVYSSEVSVEVGNPSSSTSPLKDAITSIAAEQNSRPMETVAPQHPLAGSAVTPAAKTVPGETGTASSLALLLLVSAAIGTLLAFRRQWIAVTDA